jgi:hypothetical protein
MLALREGDREASRRRNEQALADARAVEASDALALASLGLSRVAFDEREYAAARVRATEALEWAQRLDPAMGQAPLHLLAQSTRMLGDYDGAARLLAARDRARARRRGGDRVAPCAARETSGRVKLGRPGCALSLSLRRG